MQKSASIKASFKRVKLGLDLSTRVKRKVRQLWRRSQSPHFRHPSQERQTSLSVLRERKTCFLVYACGISLSFNFEMRDSSILPFSTKAHISSWGVGITLFPGRSGQGSDLRNISELDDRYLTKLILILYLLWLTYPCILCVYYFILFKLVCVLLSDLGAWFILGVTKKKSWKEIIIV